MFVLFEDYSRKLFLVFISFRFIAIKVKNTTQINIMAKSYADEDGEDRFKSYDPQQTRTQ